MADQPTTPAKKTTWDAKRQYALRDIIYYEGRQYISVWDGINLNRVPGLSGDEGYWTPVYRAAEPLTKPAIPLERPKPKPEEPKKPGEAKKPEEPKKPEPPRVPPQVITRPAPDLIIKRTPYPKWWNDEGIAKISLTSPGSQFVITARGDYSLYIATIVLTVSGECNIVFTFGQAGVSGSMDLGGADEPRGIVIAAGNSPTPCGSGSFMITATSDESVSIGGYVSYYLWKKEQGV